MSNVNKVTLIGHLGQDPDVRYTQGHQPVAHLRVATSENYTNKQGEKVETTEWHNVTVWGKQAEQVGEFLKKGRLVYIEGKLHTGSWTDKQGQKRYKTEIVAHTIALPLDSEKGGARGEPSQKPAPKTDDGGIDVGEPQQTPPDDEDIPF